LERGLPAKNHYAVCLKNRAAQFAGKPSSNGKRDFLLERGLPAKNHYAVCLKNRAAQFAGKPSSNGKCDFLWERACSRRTITRCA